ncbi:hypothetical protein [Microbacterium sp. EST19A]|uniref:hypothetical protein n=1 Tax=Microbacterium sp. EST19A TaxID=2862681 RepID=UPI001CBAEAF9|nr:hypothetical protein [Microbacterium sp. EST19A]
MLQSSLIGTAGSVVLRTVADVIFATSILLFSFGLSRDASVVDRKPLGAGALTVFALWLLLALALTPVLDTDPSSGSGSWEIYRYVTLLVPAASALIAASQIARGRTVPAPWRWAPMWVLGLCAVTWIIPQIIVATVRPESIQAFADLFVMLSALASLAGTLGLGILAVVLALRPQSGSVEVFRSA